MIWTRRSFAVSLSGALVLLPSRIVAAAGRLTISLAVDPQRVAIGDTVQLVVEIVGEGVGDGSLPEPIVTGLEPFEVEGPSTSFQSSFSFLSGQASRSATMRYTYVLAPQEPGRFHLRAEAPHGSKLVQSNLAVLKVEGEARSADSAEHAPTGKPTVASANVFLWATVDRPSVYVGQQVNYCLEVYERLRFSGIQFRTTPSFRDFWAEELPQQGQRVEHVGGVPYRVHSGIRRVLFPQRAGTLVIGAAEVTVKRGGLFNTDVKRVRGTPISVDVRPLPATGQPGGFRANNVGRFSLAAEVDHEDFRQGDPFTYKVTIQGTGNVRFVEPDPWPPLKGMRRYDPKVDLDVRPGTTTEGTRIYEFLVVPDEAGKLEIPGHRLSFFDPDKERYQTVRSDPIAIQVEARLQSDPIAKGGGAGPKATDSDSSADGGDLLADMIDLPTLPRRAPRQSWLTFDRWLAGMLAAPALGAFVFMGRVLWRKLGPDDRARARAARAAARRRLMAEARASLGSGEGFHARLAQLLQDVALSRAGADGVGLPRPELLRVLARKGVDDRDIEMLQGLLDDCDAARFAAAAGTIEDRKRMLGEALSLLRRSSLAKGVR